MNLANLSQEEKDKIDLFKQECFHRSQCKGMNKAQVKAYVNTLNEPIKSHILDLINKHTKE